MALEGPAEAAGGRDDAVAGSPRGEGNFAAGESPKAFYRHRVWSGLWAAAGLLRARSSRLEFGERDRIAGRTHLRASGHVGM
jgi:hypothetical protein